MCRWQNAGSRRKWFDVWAVKTGAVNAMVAAFDPLDRVRKPCGLLMLSLMDGVYFFFFFFFFFFFA